MKTTFQLVTLASAAAEAMLHSLPIIRSTVGLIFESLEAATQSQGQRQQSILRARGSQPSESEPMPPWLSRDFFEGTLTKASSVRTSAQSQFDDDDGLIDAMFWSIYTTPIGVGNPSLNVDAIVDTSWSPFFIPSVNCTYDPDEVRYCLIHPLYNSTLSSTYRADLTPSTLYYVGSAGLYTWGNISQDSLHVAGMEIKDQMFEEVTMMRPDIGTFDQYFDCVLGLALFETRDMDKWGNFTGPSPFHNMINQNLLDENVFTLQFARSDREKGEITFGGLPKHLHREDMIEVPLNNSKSDGSDFVWNYYTMNGWQVPVEGMSMAFNVSEVSVPVVETPQLAIIASAFPWIGLSEEAAAKANQAIGLKYGFDWLDCETRADLPNWTVSFGPHGQTISLTPWDYLIEVYDRFHKQLKCVSAFVDLDEHGDKGFVLLGAPFLNGLYTVFDADRNTISFGNRLL